MKTDFKGFFNCKDVSKADMYNVKWMFKVFSKSKELFRKIQTLLASHIKVLGGPYVAHHRPDVAQASFKGSPNF